MRLESNERYRFSNGEEMLSDATSNARILDLVRGGKKRRGERDGGERKEMGGERERGSVRELPQGGPTHRV